MSVAVASSVRYNVSHSRKKKKNKLRAAAAAKELKETVKAVGVPRPTPACSGGTAPGAQQGSGSQEGVEQAATEMSLPSPQADEDMAAAERQNKRQTVSASTVTVGPLVVCVISACTQRTNVNSYVVGCQDSKIQQSIQDIVSMVTLFSVLCPPLGAVLLK